jgi:16S rRNA (guanine(966)-N(2))-methyltransferase RsmD
MRIIAGQYRSRRLLTPRDDSVTRPIPDRAKESLFGLLRGHCEDANVFDAFAGTGALGLEALSRGAARCVFVEKDKGSADLLRRNIESLGAQDRAELVIGDALGPGSLARAPRPLTLAFFDPPYPLIREPIGWNRVKTQFQKIIDLLTDDGFAILRTPWPFTLEIKQAVPDQPPERLTKGRKRRPTREPRHGHWHEATPETLDPSADSDAADTGEAALPQVQRIPADLSIPNAIGPETHIYHTTAVHLYSRRRESVERPTP